MLSFFVKVLTLQMLKQQKHQHGGSYVVVFVCCGRERTMPPAADMTHCWFKGTPAAKMQSAATTSSIGQRRQVVGNTVFSVLFFLLYWKENLSTSIKNNQNQYIQSMYINIQIHTCTKQQYILFKS